MISRGLGSSNLAINYIGQANKYTKKRTIMWAQMHEYQTERS